MEHVGAKRHGEGNGEARIWYPLINAPTACRGQVVSRRANAAMRRDPPRAHGRWLGRPLCAGGRRGPPHRPKTARASARSRGGAAGACCVSRPSAHTWAPQRRSADVPRRSRAMQCPVSGFGGGVRHAAPPPSQIRASNASSEEGPRASTPSVLGGHRHRQALAALLAPAAQHRPAPAGAHPSPKTVFVYAPPIPRLIRSFHAKTTLDGGP